MFEKLDEIQRTKISNDIKKQVIEDLWRPSDILNENLTITEIENLSAPLYIGQDTSPDFANGKISNTQIYNRALSASEVLQNYNALKGRFGLWNTGQ